LTTRRMVIPTLALSRKKLKLGPSAMLSEYHNAADVTMSAPGQTRKSALVTAMSAFPPIATKLRTSRHVRFVPKAEVAVFIRSPRRPEQGASAVLWCQLRGRSQIDRERQPRLSTISRLFAPVVDRRRNESSSIPTACAASFVCVFVAIAWQPGRAALSN
jgi:hypothetical protein